MGMEGDPGWTTGRCRGTNWAPFPVTHGVVGGGVPGQRDAGLRREVLGSLGVATVPAGACDMASARGCPSPQLQASIRWVTEGDVRRSRCCWSSTYRCRTSR